MKKFIFGCTVFIAGFIWLTILIVLSITNPYVYNDVNGFIGFLQGTRTGYIFLLSMMMIFWGLHLMIVESEYKVKIPDWLRSEKNNVE